MRQSLESLKAQYPYDVFQLTESLREQGYCNWCWFSNPSGSVLISARDKVVAVNTRQRFQTALEFAKAFETSTGSNWTVLKQYTEEEADQAEQRAREWEKKESERLKEVAKISERYRQEEQSAEAAKAFGIFVLVLVVVIVLVIVFRSAQ